MGFFIAKLELEEEIVMTIKRETVKLCNELENIPEHLLQHLTFNMSEAAALVNMDKRIFKRYLSELQGTSEKLQVGLRFKISDIDRITSIARNKMKQALYDCTTELESCHKDVNMVNLSLEDMLK